MNQGWGHRPWPTPEGAGNPFVPITPASAVTAAPAWGEEPWIPPSAQTWIAPPIEMVAGRGRLHSGPSSFPRRCTAAILDFLILFPLLALIAWALRHRFGLEPREFFTRAVLLGFLLPRTSIAPQLTFLGVYYGYFTMFEATGGTPGKRLLRMRTLSYRREGRLGFARSLLRATIGRVVNGFFFGAGYITSLWDDERRMWGDKLGGALVVDLD